MLVTEYQIYVEQYADTIIAWWRHGTNFINDLVNTALI